MKTIIWCIIILSILGSCKIQEKSTNTIRENQDALLLSVLWYQKSAEMQALYYQGYNIAKYSLLESLKSYTGSKPKAIIMDIDETMLDNSPIEAYQVINNVPHSDSLWKKWVKKSSAIPCPGALEFTKFADSMKVAIFYITNRELPDEFRPTILNLKNDGFPFADSLHLMLKKDVNSKETRRQAIADKYEVLLLIGDNLADFDAVFDNRGNDLAFGIVRKNSDKFGSRFIILPNPMYGSWISPAIRSEQGKTIKERIMKSLRTF